MPPQAAPPGPADRDAAPAGQPVRVDSLALAKGLEKASVVEVAPVTTPWGAAVSVVLILGLVGLAWAAFHYGTPTMGAPPSAPQHATVEAVQLYEKTYAVYQGATRERSSFVKDVLLVIAPALTALGGYMLGRQSKS